MTSQNRLDRNWVPDRVATTIRASLEEQLASEYLTDELRSPLKKRSVPDLVATTSWALLEEQRATAFLTLELLSASGVRRSSWALH